MYVITLDYTAPLDRIDALRDEHMDWIRSQSAAGIVLVAGRQEPRTGGVILAAPIERTALDAALALDPFQREGVATYSVVRFIPTTAAPGLTSILETP